MLQLVRFKHHIRYLYRATTVSQLFFSQVSPNVSLHMPDEIYSLRLNAVNNTKASNCHLTILHFRTDVIAAELLVREMCTLRSIFW